jgi:AraC-like DNA-binding protein
MSDVPSRISPELRELCLSVFLADLGTCGSKVRKLVGNDTIALLSFDKYKNVILLSDLAAAEAVHSTSSKTPEQADEPLAFSRRRPSGLQTWRLRRVQDYIGAHIADAIRLEDLARAAGLTRMYFAAQFRVKMGVRPHEYVARQRIARAQVLLMVPQTRIIEVGLCVGFISQAHFTTVFRRYVGITPHRWRLTQTPEGWAKSAKTRRSHTDPKSFRPHRATARDPAMATKRIAERTIREARDKNAIRIPCNSSVTRNQWIPCGAS